MERIDKILQHELYKEYVGKIELAERDREFCKHDMVHFLDVCRLAMVLYLKEQADAKDIKEEWIYAAGILHDIGRWQEYEEGIRHEVASSQLAPAILRGCDFFEEEIEEICTAIGNHRNKDIKDQSSLSGILYRADKMSRPCFSCKAEKICNWDKNKKNLQIQY